MCTFLSTKNEILKMKKVKKARKNQHLEVGANCIHKM